MIARLAGLLVRVLLETSLLLLIIAALCGVLAFRVSRRIVRSDDGKLDRFSATVVPLLEKALAVHAAASRDPGVAADDSV